MKFLKLLRKRLMDSLRIIFTWKGFLMYMQEVLVLAAAIKYLDMNGMIGKKSPAFRGLPSWWY